LGWEQELVQVWWVIGQVWGQELMEALCQLEMGKGQVLPEGLASLVAMVLLHLELDKVQSREQE